MLSEILRLSNFISNEYARALVIFVLLVIVLKIILSIAGRVLLNLASKTKTELDDILIKKMSGPLTVIALLIALRISMGELVLSEGLSLNMISAIWSGFVIAVGYLVYVSIDTILIRAWKHTALRAKTKLDENFAHLVQGILKIVLILLAVLYILDLWGVEVVPILGALGIAGLAVALALQPLLSNIFSGIAMVMDKSVRVGDWVILEDGVWGIVNKIGIRSTKLRTFDNEMLIIPNSKFSESRIQNVSLPEPKVRIVIPFGVAYGSDTDKVKKVVEEEIKKIPHLDKSEEISVRFLEMGDSALKFKAYFYIGNFENRLSTIDEATTKIYKVLNKEGISIPFPQMDVHLKK